MPDFLKKLLLLTAANLAGVKVLSLNSHNPKAELITLVIMFVANLAIWKWEFE